MHFCLEIPKFLVSLQPKQNIKHLQSNSTSDSSIMVFLRCFMFFSNCFLLADVSSWYSKRWGKYWSHRKRNITLLLLENLSFTEKISIFIFGGNGWPFPSPRTGKAILMDNKPPRNFQSSLKIKWEQLPQFACSWMIRWSRRTIRLGNKVDSYIHWDFVPVMV